MRVSASNPVSWRIQNGDGSVALFDFLKVIHPWLINADVFTLMIPEADPKVITAKLCEFARSNFVAEGVEFDEHSPLSQAGIDSFALVELVLFCERVLGVRVPDSQLTGDNLASMSALAQCVASLAKAAQPA